MSDLSRPCFTASSFLINKQVLNRLGRVVRAAAAFAVLGICAPTAWAAQQATTTTLAVTAGGAPVTTVPAQTVVTLTATVTAGGAAVTTGQVKFCDATATYCTDIHVLGTAQLTSAGLATFKFKPGAGSRSYKAVFVGTNPYATSTSSNSRLVVTGSYPTSTGITSTGGPGTFSLTATVAGVGLNNPAPSGSVSFLDTSNSNAVLGSATLGSGPSTLNFINSANPTVGFSPGGILVADFSGDGIPDIATLNSQSQTITVSLGNGDGTFTAATTIPIGKFANAFTVADFNGDGFLDLAVVFNNNYVGSTGSFVTVLLGNGDGTFIATPTSPTVGNNPAGIAAGDFNGDGVQDLAVANQIDGTITILLGNGDGTFRATSVSLTTGSQPGSAVAADFNGDGKLDLAVANLGSDTLSIFLGNGDGTFTPAASPTVGVYPDSVVAADLNGDGIQDLVVGNEQSNVTVLLGVGNGTFRAASSPGLAMVVAIGDFNGDGIPDLAGTQGYVTHIFLGNGDGTFSAAPTYTPKPLNSELEFTCITAGDLNGDGHSDLAMAGLIIYGSGPNGQSQVLLSNPQSTSLASASVTVGPGSHLVEASYSGDTNYSSSLSTTATLAGKPVPTILNLNVPAGPYTVGQSLILTATLSPYMAAGYSTNGETVSFKNGTTLLGTGTLSGGVAAMNFVVPTAGQYSFAAVYGGDLIFVGSSSNTIALTASLPHFVVNTSMDSAGTPSNCTSATTTPCSLRDALAASQSHGGAITFDPNVFTATNSPAQNTITLGSAGTMAIPANTTITGATSGSGSALTNLVTVSGNNAYGVFSVASSATATAMSNLTIINGMGSNGSAVNNAGSLTVNQCTFSNNTASQGYGGAIQNSSQLSVNGSTFTNNKSAVFGGAIYSTSILTVNGSTLTAAEGSAIYNSNSLTMTNNTITGNSGYGALFNEGLATGSNNILSGDTGGDECDGDGCYTSANTAYLLVSGTDQQIGGVWDSGLITLGWNTGSYSVGYGQFSTPSGIAAGFGGGISGSSSTASAAAFGPYFELGARTSLGTITVTNTSKSFTVTQVYQTALFASAGNLVGTAAKLSSLGNYGGPTQTMIPLPGSLAICRGIASGLAPGVITDQRGLPNTNASYSGYSSGTPCVDAGSVQTNYALSFTSQPPASVTALSPFSAAVTLTESGSAFTASPVAIPLTLTGSGSLLNFSVSTSNGVATYPSLSVSLPGTGDNLNASLTLNGNVAIAAPSNGFTVLAGPTTTSAVSQTATFSPGAQGIALTAQVTSGLGTVSAGSVTFTVIQGSTSIGTSATSPVSSGRATVFYGLPGGTAAGTYTIQAVYNAGGAFATSNDNTQTVTIGQANSVIAWTAPAAVSYGTALSASQLNATSPLAGAFTYSPVSGTVLGAGPHTLTATFAPADTTDYTPATATVTLTVNKATPAITWLPPTAIVYGTALSAAQLNATAPTPGVFAYTPSVGTVLNAGSHPLSVSFAPTDTADYLPASGANTVIVNQAPLTVTAASASRTYGAANPTFTSSAVGVLNGDLILLGGSSVAGPTSAVGAYPIVPVVGGTNLASYSVVYVNGTLMVTPAALAVVPSTTTRTYGIANPVLTGSVAGALNGDTFSVTGSTTATATSPVGSYPITYNVVAINGSLANYTVTPATGTLTISSATPTITWSMPSAVTYGTPLSAAQLNATASVPGSLVYTPALGATLPAGMQTLSVSFAPTDSTDYAAPPATTVPITINKAPLAITANSVARVFGAVNPAFSGTVNGAVNGDAFTESFATTATPASIVGSYPIMPSVAGANLANYAVTPSNGALTIAQAGTSTTFALSNSNLTLTATVASLTSGTPSGSVGFYEGQTLIGTSTLSNGIASFTATTFPAGNVVVSAQYSGDANFTQSASPPIFVLSMTPALSTLNISTSGSASDTITLAAASGFTGTLQLSCTGLPQNTICSFQPASVTFNGLSNSASAIMTVQTGTSASVLAPSLFHSNPRLAALAGIFWLPAVLLAGFARRARKLHRHLYMLLFAVLLGGLCTLITACGSSAPMTPAGTSTLQVVATGPSGFTQITAVTLTVQ